jgi:type IV/VI secretion system ImpK/VasF family protein
MREEPDGPARDTDDSTRALFRLVSPLFLYAVTFRRKVRKGIHPDDVSVFRDLDDIFTRMEVDSRADPRLDVLYEKVKYPLVVFADEILVESDWRHAATWTQSHLLEEKYFQTNIGGDKLFQVAAEVDARDSELAAILYTVISLGVKGAYFRMPERLAEIKSRLYRHLSEQLASTHGAITPDAYRVNERAQVRVRPAVTLLKVAVAVIGGLALYWLAAYWAWETAVTDLRQIVGELAVRLPR